MSSSHPHPLTGRARQAFPFDHLTLAEVDESRRLWNRLAEGKADMQDKVRLKFLHDRRVFPICDSMPKGAA